MHYLKFTGNCNRAEFEVRCAQQDFWYHSYYFDNGFVQRGNYNIGLNVVEYGFPKTMAGMSVLDVGTASGWFATYFEQLGAAVTTVDLRGWCDWDIFNPTRYAKELAAEKLIPDWVFPDGSARYFMPINKGFGIMKDLLELKATFVNARVYDLCPELFGGKKFDLVFLGSVLMHVRDPIGAVMAARSVCRHRLIANSLILPGPEDDAHPVMELLADLNPLWWWRCNKLCLTKWFRGAGFAEINADRTVHLTVDKPYAAPGEEPDAADQTLYLVDAYV